MDADAWHEKFAKLVEESRRKAGCLIDEHGNVIYAAGDRARRAASRIKEEKER